MQFPFITYGMALLTAIGIYQQNTIPLHTQKSMNMRESGAIELRNFFTISHSSNCYLFQYCVGTSDTLSVQTTCLSDYMYRQNSERTLLGVIPPPPSSGYATV